MRVCVSVCAYVCVCVLRRGVLVSVLSWSHFPVFFLFRTHTHTHTHAHSFSLSQKNILNCQAMFELSSTQKALIWRFRYFLVENKRVCMYVCVYVCMCVYVCVCLCVCMYVCMYVCAFMWLILLLLACIPTQALTTFLKSVDWLDTKDSKEVRTCVCVCVCACMCVCMYVCVCECMYV